MDAEVKVTDCRSLLEALDACVQREIQFTSDLTVLKEVYVDVLLHDAQSPKPRLIPHNQDIVVYYSAVASLLTLHVRFSQELAAKRAVYRDSQPVNDASLEAYAREVASTFSRFAPLFQLYGQFSAKHLVVYTLVSDAMVRSFDDPAKTKPFRKFLEDAQATGRTGSDPGEYLLRLLSTTSQEFDELERAVAHIQSLIPEGPLHDHFGDAVRSMQQTGTHIREQVNLIRRKEQVHAIEEAWGMKLTQPGRFFLREGTLTKVSRRTDIIYTFVLFSDILMYGAPAALGRVTHHRTMSVASIRVQECMDRPNAFRIISDEKSFVVVAASHQDKADWMTELIQAVSKLQKGKTDVALSADDVNEKGSHAPIWKPDSTTNECYVCHTPFNLLNRRHHCRRCGELVCGGCSPYRLPLNKLVSTSKSDALSRACKPCAMIVLETMPEEERALYENPEEGRGLFKRSSSRFDSPSQRRLGGGHRTTDSVGSIPAPPEESPVTPHHGLAQAAASAQSDAPKVQKSSRQLVVEEMLSTERTYVENIRTLDQLFVQPILVDAQSKRPTIGKLCDITSENNLTSMSLFLHSIENLLMINERLLQDLTERVRNWKDSDTIGDIFANYAPLFTMYSQYTDAQEFASQTLVEFREKSREFREFLAEAEANPRCNHQTLQSFLIMPIQRVPRYQLLLQECLKQTSKLFPDHKDIPLINGALEQVKDAATHVNAVVHVRENKNRIFELAAIWRGEKLAAPGRRLVREGPLIKQCRRAPKEFYFLLFNDVLMYGQEDATGSYNHHRVIDLRSCKVAEQQTASESPHAAFQILSKAKAFVVYTDSVEQRDAWMNDINQSIAELRAKLGITEDDQTFAAIWVPDDHVKNCTLCDQPFSLVLRRHHCRGCGRVCCAPCSAHRKVLPHIDPTKEVRICDKCYGENADTTDALTTNTSEARSSGRDTAADVRGAFMEAREGDTEPSMTPTNVQGVAALAYDSSDDDDDSSIDSDEEDGPTAADFAALANADIADVAPRDSFATRSRSKTRDGVGLQIKSFPVQVFALYDFFPQEDGELALTRQQVLTATEGVADRLFGTNQDGVSGWFPASYVSVLTQPLEQSTVDAATSEAEVPQA